MLPSIRPFCAVAVVFYLLSPGLSLRSSAQDSTLSGRIREWRRYTAGHNGSSLYVYTDKSTYVPNSYILFTGYIFKGDHDTNQYHTIYVELADPEKQRTVASDRFVMRGIVGDGALYLPDTLRPGPYLLICYTDVVVHGQKQQPFRRMIYIRSPEEHAFRLKVGAATASQDSLRVKCRITTSYGGLASGGSFSYRLACPSGMLQVGVRKIDAFGEVTLCLPLADSLLDELMLSAVVKRDTVTTTFWVPVRVTREAWDIRFYPEGGNFVSGHSSRVGIVLRNGHGRGVAAEGVLLEDGNVVCNFQTDGNGLGSLNCVPFADKKYTVQLTSTLAPLRVDFPKVESEGFTLAIAKGVVRNSMTVRLQAPGPGSRCTLMVYTNRDVLYASSLHLLSGEGIVRIPIDSSLNGLATVSLFDSAGVAVAERTIYFPGRPLNVSVQSDSTEYHTHSKITLHIKVTDKEGKGVSSVFSLSSVLSSRTDLDKDPDITNFASYDGGMDSLPSVGPLPWPGEEPGIELALLTRFWTRDRWAAMATDTMLVGPFNRVTDSGYVLYRDKRVKAPAQLVLVGEAAAYRTIETDSLGCFTLPEAAAIAPSGSHILLSVTGENQDLYTLRLFNGYDTINHVLARDWYYPPADPTDVEDVMDQPFDDKEFNSVKTIQTVVIKAGEDGYYGDATCNDYVCVYNVLNCPGHRYGSTRPVIGKTYTYYPAPHAPGSMGHIVYRGCVDPKMVSSFLNEIQPIHTHPDFYHPDTLGCNAPILETMVNSTLFWSPLTVTDKNGEATLTFYTQELPGRFYNIVQGISEEGVISGKGAFKIIQ